MKLMDKKTSYNVSRREEEIQLNKKVGKRPQNLYKKLRGKKAVTKKELQKLSNYIFDFLGLESIDVTFKGSQPYSKRGTRLASKKKGYFKHSNFSKPYINVFRYTAIKKKEYAPKSAIKTLIHEIVHYYDTYILGIKSLHTRGFYKRINDLENKLKGCE